MFPSPSETKFISVFTESIKLAYLCYDMYDQWNMCCIETGDTPIYYWIFSVKINKNALYLTNHFILHPDSSVNESVKSNIISLYSFQMGDYYILFISETELELHSLCMGAFGGGTIK